MKHLTTLRVALPLLLLINLGLFALDTWIDQLPILILVVIASSIVLLAVYRSRRLGAIAVASMLVLGGTLALDLLDAGALPALRI